MKHKHIKVIIRKLRLTWFQLKKELHYYYDIIILPNNIELSSVCMVKPV